MEKSANAHIDKLLKEASVDGQLISPMLPTDVKNYLIDIDGTAANSAFLLLGRTTLVVAR